MHCQCTRERVDVVYVTRIPLITSRRPCTAESRSKLIVLTKWHYRTRRRAKLTPLSRLNTCMYATRYTTSQKASGSFILISDIAQGRILLTRCGREDRLIAVCVFLHHARVCLWHSTHHDQPVFNQLGQTFVQTIACVCNVCICICSACVCVKRVGKLVII